MLEKRDRGKIFGGVLFWNWKPYGHGQMREKKGMKDTPRCLLCKHQKKKFTRTCSLRTGRNA